MQVVAPDRVTNYFGQRGLFVSPARLELFTNTFAEDDQKSLEQLLLKITETLPHTPMTALGTNFHFAESDMAAEIADKLKTREGLETKFQVGAQSFASSIVLPNATLNLRREVHGGGYSIDFNFHRSELSAGVLSEIVPGLVARRFKEAVGILEDLYDVDVATLDYLVHQFPEIPAT